jgi:Zn finger protein HypA/HybF involved in hydrogenase expression
MNIGSEIKKLANEFWEVVTNKGQCGCRQPFVFVTSPEDFKVEEDRPCPRCGGRKIVILVDEDDLKA